MFKPKSNNFIQTLSAVSAQGNSTIWNNAMRTVILSLDLNERNIDSKMALVENNNSLNTFEYELLISQHVYNNPLQTLHWPAIFITTLLIDSFNSCNWVIRWNKRTDFWRKKKLNSSDSNCTVEMYWII